VYALELGEKLGAVVFGEENMVQCCSNSVTVVSIQLLQNVWSSYSILSHSANLRYSGLNSWMVFFCLISEKSFVNPSMRSQSTSPSPNKNSNVLLSTMSRLNLSI